MTRFTVSHVLQNIRLYDFSIPQTCKILFTPVYNLYCASRKIVIAWVGVMWRVFITMKHRVPPIIINGLCKANLGEHHKPDNRLIEIGCTLLWDVTKSPRSRIYVEISVNTCTSSALDLFQRVVDIGN